MTTEDRWNDIVSLTSAMPDWYAIIEDPDGSLVSYTIVAWALVAKGSVLPVFLWEGDTYTDLDFYEGVGEYFFGCRKRDVVHAPGRFIDWDKYTRHMKPGWELATYLDGHRYVKASA